MNKLYLVLIIILLTSSSLMIYGQPAGGGPPGGPGGPPCWPPPCIPVDGGVGVLIAIASLIGIKKIYSKNINQDS